MCRTGHSPKGRPRGPSSFIPQNASLMSLPFMWRQSAMLCTLILGFVACQSGDQSPSADATQAAELTSCLPAYFAQPAQLLTLEAVADAVQRPASTLTTDHLEGQSQPLINTASYSWGEEERTKSVTVGEHTMELPYGFHVSLRHLEQLDQDDPVAYFQQTYRSFTEEEQKALQARMEAELQKRIDAGEITADQAQLADGFSSMFTQNASYDPVPDVGTAAAWNAQTQELAVLTGDVVFHILADASTDAARNRAIAIQLAQLVIAHCP